MHYQTLLYRRCRRDRHRHPEPPLNTIVPPMPDELEPALRRTGTSYSRMWGCFLTGMWLDRLGLTKAKLALSGKTLSGREALEASLINDAVPFARMQEEGAPAPGSSLRSRSPALRAGIGG